LSSEPTARLPSYRRLFARLGDDLATKPVSTFGEVCDRWTDLFWAEYQGSSLLQDYASLAAKKPVDPAAATPDPAARTKDEEERYSKAPLTLGVGFCLAGYVKTEREPKASEIIFSPGAPKPMPASIPIGFKFWGAPNMIRRLIFGNDEKLKTDLIASGKWSGTDTELDEFLQQYQLFHPPTLPIRDAIDFVHSCVFSTIKALKFSNLSQICGGPIEIAVITADRPFRWVQHKEFDSAIREGAP
jgi:hypothetical protein